MKKKWRILTLCMVLVMLCSMLPFAASAAQPDTIAVDDIKDVVIANPGEYVDFYFTPAETAVYLFYSRENVMENQTPLDTYGFIYQGETLIAEDDEEGGYANFRVEAELTAGTQYILRADTYSGRDIGSMKVVLKKLVPATGIEIFGGKKTIKNNLGAFVEANVTFFPENAAREEYTIESSDENVIKDGICVGVGTTTVTVTTDSGLTADVAYTVLPSTPLKIGEEQRTGMLNEVDSTYEFIAPADGVYVFYMRDCGITRASVWEKGFPFDFIGSSAGETDNYTVTFAAEKGKVYYITTSVLSTIFSANTIVGVLPQAEPAIKAEQPEYITYVGSSVTPKFVPALLHSEKDWNEVLLTISDSTIATVSDNGDRIIMNDVGTVTVTGTTNTGLRATCKVTAVEPTKLTKTGYYSFQSTVKHSMVLYEFVAPEAGDYFFGAVKTAYTVAEAMGQKNPDGSYTLAKGESLLIMTMTLPDLMGGLTGRFYVLNAKPDCNDEHQFAPIYGFTATTNHPGALIQYCKKCLLTQQTQPEQLKITKAADKRFTDVKKKDWFYDEVNFAANSNLFAGTSKTEFSPNDQMTRGMFVTVLGRLSGVAADKTVTTKFKDVKKGQYYTAYVKWANEAGIVSGITATTFAPDANITREQICVIMEKYLGTLGLGLRTDFAKVKFADEAEIAKWAKNAVLACQQGGIINGIKQGSGYVFNPQGNATRAEVATILYNFTKNYFGRLYEMSNEM